MKIEKITNIMSGEKPLDNIVCDGGYASIFLNIGCIGDSLSSGEFESVKEDGSHTYDDYYEFSWGQFLARDTGVKVYNFSCGGMSCREYMRWFGNHIDAFNKDKRCQAYIIALGVNDLYNPSVMVPLGKIDDYENKKETMSRYYQEIIKTYKNIEPNAKFFLVTMPREDEREEDDKIKQEYRKLIYQIADKFSNIYVIDLYQYAPKYDEEFKRKFYLNGHMNAAGYRFTAKIIESYIDYIVRQNFEDFTQVGFIGKEQYDPKLDKIANKTTNLLL